VANEAIKAKEPSYGGESTSGGVEARVARVEAHIEHILTDLSALKADIRDIRGRLAKIEARLYHLPTKDFVVIAAIVTIGLIGATITFQQQIQSWIGIIPHR